MPIRWAPRAERNERGAAAVELALVLPLVLLLVCGIVDFGRMLNIQITLSAAAREGARWAALNQPNPASRVALAAPGLAPVVTVSGCPASPPPGTNATVVASTTYTLLTPLNTISGLFGGGVPGTVTLIGQGVMRCGG
jgi:Flp pilus assembly protein TadG